MAAPTVGTAGTNSAGTGASVTPTLPAGISADDIILVWAVSCETGGTATTVFTWPSGFTEGRAVSIKSSTGTVNGLAGWAWKRAAGGESGTITVSRDGSTGNSTSFLSNCVAITGCINSGNPFEVDAFNNPNWSTTADWPSITTIGPNDTLVILFLHGDNVNTSTPTNYTAVVSNATTSGKDSGADCDKRENVGPGTYDPANATISGDDTGYATFQIAFTDQAPTVVIYTQPTNLTNFGMM